MSLIEIAMGSNSDVVAIRRVDVKLRYLCASLIGKEVLGTKQVDGKQKRYTGQEVAEKIRWTFHRLQKLIKQGDFEKSEPLKVFNVILTLDNVFMSQITDSLESGGLRTQATQLFREFIEAYYGKPM